MMNTKIQGSRFKAKGSRFFPCTLFLIKLLAIRLGWQTTPAKSLVIAPCCSHLASPAVQRGFSLVSAIFLLVVIAALGTFAVTLSTTQQQSAALDVLGARAYQASRAGIEWGAYQVLRNSGSCAATQQLAAMPGTLAGFTVTVTCTPSPSNPFYEAGTPVNMYLLTSTATQGAVTTPNYIERQMTVTIAQ